MANFDQRGQSVINQVNAESVDVINFGLVQNKKEFIDELRKFLAELNKETHASLVNKTVLVDVETNVKKAIDEAEKTKPKKESIVKYIEDAKSLLDSVASATGLVTTLIQAAKIVGGFF